MFQSNLVMLMLNLKNAFQVDLKIFSNFHEIHASETYGLSAMLKNMLAVATP